MMKLVKQLDGEEVIDPVQLTVELQIPEVGVGHPEAQRGQTSSVSRPSRRRPGRPARWDLGTTRCVRS